VQRRTYPTQFNAVSVTGSISVEPFFSPDHSIDTLTNMILDAPAGSTIDIGIPGIDSWSGCTDTTNNCVGCTVQAMQNESFPIFAALLNAVHNQGMTVNFLTNNYNIPTCSGMIAPLDWFALNNGINVRYYTSTTFLHAKYAQVHPPKSGSSTDRKAAISSVNYSKTSFTKNREAGVVLTGGNSQADSLLDAADQVYQFDWSQSVPYVVNNTYSPQQMAIITSTASLPVVIPSPPNIPGSYITPVPSPITTKSSSESTIFFSPDNSMDGLLKGINATQYKIMVHIYQVTDTLLCQDLLNLFNNGVNVTLLVSSYIDDKTDYALAKECYNTLYDAGMNFRLTPKYYTFSHQKYWIIDDSLVGMSTGNWSPSDFNWPMPGEDGNYPPYPDPDWQITNRDIQFTTTDWSVLDVFKTVINEDYSRSTDYYPEW
jgi:HKD family nuclease